MHFPCLLRSSQTGEPFLHGFMGQDHPNMELRGALWQSIYIQFCKLTFMRQTGECVSSTQAHNDFVKTLLVIPWLDILVSGGSDRQINLWDLQPFRTGEAKTTRSLQKLKTLKEHTRPVEALALAEPGTLGCAANEAIFYSADSMGVIRSWLVRRDQLDEDSRSSTNSRNNGVTVTMKGIFEGHHTSVPEMMVGEGGLWSGERDSVDCTSLALTTLHAVSSFGRQPSPLPPNTANRATTRANTHRASRLRQISPPRSHGLPPDSSASTDRLSRRTYPHIRRLRDPGECRQFIFRG